MNYNPLFAFTRLLLILIFVYTGCSKLIGYPLFFQQLSAISYIHHFAGFIAITLPLTEIITGIILTFSKTEITGYWISAILLTVFTTHILSLIIHHSTICSCGGIISSLSWNQHLVLNIFLACLASFRIYHHYKIINLVCIQRE